MKDFGTHFLIELFECERETIAQADSVLSAALEACSSAHATVISHQSHQFEPHGATALILLAESHLSIHTWPEKGYAAADFFSCGADMKTDAAARMLKARFKSNRTEITAVSRGSSIELIDDA